MLGLNWLQVNTTVMKIVIFKEFNWSNRRTLTAKYETITSELQFKLFNISNEFYKYQMNYLKNSKCGPSECQARNCARKQPH